MVTCKDGMDAVRDYYTFSSWQNPLPSISENFLFFFHSYILCVKFFTLPETHHLMPRPLLLFFLQRT